MDEDRRGPREARKRHAAADAVTRAYAAVAAPPPLVRGQSKSVGVVSNCICAPLRSSICRAALEMGSPGIFWGHFGAQGRLDFGRGGVAQLLHD